MEAYLDRGNTLAEKGDFDDAIKDFDEAIKLNSKGADPYLERGIVWAKTGSFDKAIQDFDQAVKLDPKEGEAYNQIAWLKATCPDPAFRNGEEAVENATKACELTAWKTWEVLDTLAAAYAEKGDFENAVKWENNALDLATTESDKEIGRQRLALYDAKKPYREEVKK